MRETQLDAWEDIKPTLSDKQKIVEYVIRTSGKEGLCLFELSKRLGWPINRVSGRVTELSDNQVIIDSGLRRINPESGKRAIVWVCK